MNDKKDRTVSFRVSEETFRELSKIADERETTLSDLFREYVDALVKYGGDISLKNEKKEEYPPKVEVPTEMVREHERLELENKHLNERLEECEKYIEKLESEKGEEITLGKVD